MGFMVIGIIFSIIAFVSLVKSYKNDNNNLLDYFEDIFVLFFAITFIISGVTQKTNQSERYTVTAVYTDSIIVERLDGSGEKTIKEDTPPDTAIGDMVDGNGKLID